MPKIQTNVQHGSTVRPAAEDLTGKEGRFVVIDANGAFALAGANPVDPLYVLMDGGEAGDDVTAEPLTSGKRYRVRASNANFALKGRVTSGANGLAVLLTVAVPGANPVSMAGVVEEAVNVAVADTGAVLILATPQLTTRA